METLIKILNAPITIWLLSSVIIGFVTWVYKSSTARRSEKRLAEVLIDKAEEELYLLSEDLILVASNQDSISTQRVQYLIERTQYLPFDLAKNEYRPTVYNILLQLQSYTGNLELKTLRQEIIILLRQLIMLRDNHQTHHISDNQTLILSENEVHAIGDAIKFYEKLSKQFAHSMKKE